MQYSFTSSALALLTRPISCPLDFHWVHIRVNGSHPLSISPHQIRLLRCLTQLELQGLARTCLILRCTNSHALTHNWPSTISMSSSMVFKTFYWSLPGHCTICCTHGRFYLEINCTELNLRAILWRWTKIETRVWAGHATSAPFVCSGNWHIDMNGHLMASRWSVFSENQDLGGSKGITNDWWEQSVVVSIGLCCMNLWFGRPVTMPHFAGQLILINNIISQMLL